MSSKKSVFSFFNQYLNKMAVVALILICSINLFAEKYAGEIFKIGAGVRNFALGRTGLTDLESPAKAYWNSALLVSQTNLQTEIMHAEEFSGNLTYDIASINFANNSNLGLVLTRIAIDDVKKTALPNPDSLPSNDNRPYAYKSISNSDYLLYLGMGRSINDHFMIGLSPKFVYRSLSEESCYGFGADFSAFYSLNSKLNFAVKLRDFFSTQMFYENGTHQSINPGLDLEGSVVTTLPIFLKRTIIYLNTEINAEGMKESASLNTGNLSYDFHTGVQIDASNNIKLYSGYDIDSITAGISLILKNCNLNYSYENNTELDNSHRISLGMNL